MQAAGPRVHPGFEVSAMQQPQGGGQFQSPAQAGGFLEKQVRTSFDSARKGHQNAFLVQLHPLVQGHLLLHRS